MTPIEKVVQGVAEIKGHLADTNDLLAQLLGVAEQHKRIAAREKFDEDVAIEVKQATQIELMARWLANYAPRGASPCPKGITVDTCISDGSCWKCWAKKAELMAARAAYGADA